MPSKKKKYNARFPAGRIKKIMQTDEEVGKVAQAVPVIISKALEMFIESLLKKSMHITQNRSAKTLTPSHMKQCILSESRFDFLKDLVKNIPDASIQEDNENNALADSNDSFGVIPDEPGTPIETTVLPKEKRKDAISTAANFYTPQTSSSSRTPVIQFGSRQTTSKQENSSLFDFSVTSILSKEPKIHVTIASEELNKAENNQANHKAVKSDPPLPSIVPVSTSVYGSNSAGDNLCIDEDYDN